MECPNCNTHVPLAETICPGCGYDTAPSASEGAALLRKTARLFLLVGCINVVAGIVITAMGWPGGLFSVLVGIIEIVNAAAYWRTPPTFYAAPTYVAVLEIVNVFISCGSLWSLLAGWNNLTRLRQPAVTAYLTILRGSPAGVPMVAAGQQKKCPKCAEMIRIDAVMCRFCRHEFDPSDVEMVRQQAAQSAAAVAPPRDETPYAGFGQRTGAMLIDGGLWGLFFAAGSAIVALLEERLAPGQKGAFGAVFMLLQVPILWIYSAVLESSPHQATLGKRVAKIVVTDLAGRRLSFRRASGRFFAKFASSFFFYAGWFVAAFSERRQALHDMMAATLVVRAGAGTARDSSA